MSTNLPINDPNAVSKNTSSPTTPQQTNPDIALSLRTMEDDLTEIKGVKPDTISFSVPNKIIPASQTKQDPVSLSKTPPTPQVKIESSPEKISFLPTSPTAIQSTIPPESVKSQQPATTFQVTSVKKEASQKVPSLSEIFNSKNPGGSTNTIHPKRAFNTNENVFEGNQVKKNSLPEEKIKNEPFIPKEKLAPQSEISFEPSKTPPTPQVKIESSPEKISFLPTSPIKPISMPSTVKLAPTLSKDTSPESFPPKQTQSFAEKTFSEKQASITFPKWPIRLGVIACVLLFLGGGFWYWKQTTDITPMDPDEKIILTPIPTPTPKPAPAFNLQGTNDIIITINSFSPESFKTTLTELSQKIKDNSIQQPIEFRIIDENNNPLTFSTWTTLMKMSFSPKILATLADSFSLFLYNDSGYIRTGLKITSNNPSQTTTLLTENESSLLTIFSPLYFNYQPTLPAVSPSFKTGSYNGISTRYINFPVPEAPFIGGLSLDYASINQYIIFGTSKQTVRSVIDTLTPSNTPPLPSP